MASVNSKAIIGDLYVQVLLLTERNAELEAALDEAKDEKVIELVPEKKKA